MTFWLLNNELHEDGALSTMRSMVPASSPTSTVRLGSGPGWHRTTISQEANSQRPTSWAFSHWPRCACSILSISRPIPTYSRISGASAAARLSAGDGQKRPRLC